jgi:hypothetical protein
MIGLWQIVNAIAVFLMIGLVLSGTDIIKAAVIATCVLALVRSIGMG